MFNILGRRYKNLSIVTTFLSLVAICVAAYIGVTQNKKIIAELDGPLSIYYSFKKDAVGEHVEIKNFIDTGSLVGMIERGNSRSDSDKDAIIKFLEENITVDVDETVEVDWDDLRKNEVHIVRGDVYQRTDFPDDMVIFCKSYFRNTYLFKTLGGDQIDSRDDLHQLLLSRAFRSVVEEYRGMGNDEDGIKDFEELAYSLFLYLVVHTNPDGISTGNGDERIEIADTGTFYTELQRTIDHGERSPSETGIRPEVARPIMTMLDKIRDYSETDDFTNVISAVNSNR